MNESMLWYNNAAENFDSALPVGNGRIGGWFTDVPNMSLYS